MGVDYEEYFREDCEALGLTYEEFFELGYYDPDVRCEAYKYMKDPYDYNNEPKFNWKNKR